MQTNHHIWISCISNVIKKQLPKYNNIPPAASLCGCHDIRHRPTSGASSRRLPGCTSLGVIYGVREQQISPWCCPERFGPQTTITPNEIDCVLRGQEPIFLSVPFRKYCTIYCLVVLWNIQLQPNADLRQFNLKLRNMLKGCNDILCYMHQNHLAWQ